MSRTYEADLSTFRERILKNFKARTVPFHGTRAIELKPPNYPPDWLVTSVDPGNFLSPYKSIPGPRRAGDLLIDEPTGDVYWTSEYETAAGAVKFLCGFILHFEEAGPLRTEVQVFEKVPEVWIGERWALLHEGIGFGKVHDIRPVEPTVKDRLDLLDVLDALR